jgi:hypothetical protein
MQADKLERTLEQNDAGQLATEVILIMKCWFFRFVVCSERLLTALCFLTCRISLHICILKF